MNIILEIGWSWRGASPHHFRRAGGGQAPAAPPPVATPLISNSWYHLPGKLDPRQWTDAHQTTMRLGQIEVVLVRLSNIRKKGLGYWFAYIYLVCRICVISHIDGLIKPHIPSLVNFWGVLKTFKKCSMIRPWSNLFVLAGLSWHSLIYQHNKLEQYQTIKPF